ncbi:MAG: hypothetical protein J7L35_11130 [Anaerolineales bacterium]|nr:hypothetical protein [Anaerolineales bacterium]
MPSISIQNIVKQTSVIQDLMTLRNVASASQAGDSFQALNEDLKQNIHHSVAAIDLVLDQQDTSPADLAIRSRRAYQWLKHLDKQENLESHLDALQRINLFLPAVKLLPKYKRFRVEFIFFHTSALFQIQGKSSLIQITTQESLTSAPDTVLIALLETALGRPSQSTRQQIREYTFSPYYQSTREHLEFLGIPKGSFAKGSVHDLAKSFKRVNLAYFGEQISEPHLVWNNRLTVRKFGHYQWDTDTVMVSRTLDQRRVPEFVVDYVMYHELLHKKLGARLVNSRRMVHTNLFHQEEAKFARLDEAQNYLNKKSRKRK